ncbi:MAG: hypothetical protein F6J87_04525 [Spirulina sp. SIO3F2]|nr:hypothetical protein [Spirulina sp. SIO3F2]
MASHLPEPDPTDPQRIEQLRCTLIRLRWVVAGVLWVLILPWAAWVLRDEVALLYEYFTWAALRYAIVDNFKVTLALSLCLGVTTSTLVRQSWTILFGLTPKEQYRLGQLLAEIDRQGRKHPLWRWVHPKSS